MIENGIHMKHSIQYLFSVFFAASTLTACGSKAGTGALVGTGVGAVGGGLVTGTPTGVVVGGVVGAVAGAMIGSSLEDSDRNSLNKVSPSTVDKIDKQEKLSIEDIKSMSDAGFSDETIIQQIDATNSVFELSPEEESMLKRQGVSEKVISYMKAKK